MEEKRGEYVIEYEVPNPYVKPANRRGNNGYNTYHSGRRPMIWKQRTWIADVTEKEAIEFFSPYLQQDGVRVVNWGNLEVVAEGRKPIE